MRTLRVLIVPLAILVAAVSCVDFIGVGVGRMNWGCCDMGGGAGGNGPWSFPVLPVLDNLVTGDTMRISALAGPDGAQWEISGPAVFVVGPDSVATRIIAVREVLVRGVGSGDVTLKAVTNTDSAVTGFRVADPSEVSLRVVQGKDSRIQVGVERVITAQLRDTLNRIYRGSLGWVSTDAATVELLEPLNGAHQTRIARARAVGSVKVVVAYLQQRDTARVVVDP